MEWEDLTKAYSKTPNVTETLRRELQRQGWRMALEVASHLDIEDKKSLFQEIFSCVMSIHGINTVRSIIGSLPRDWVMSRLENELEKHLGDDATDYEYRMILNFCSDYDSDIAVKIAKRALSHEDENIRDVGEDFREYLGI